MKLSEIARITGADIIQGSPEIEIESAAGLDIAGKTEITFLANPRYASKVADTNAGAIFVGKESRVEREDIALLQTEDPYVAYTVVLRKFHPDAPLVPGIHDTAVVGDSEIAADVQISANVVIGDGCVISTGVRIFPNVTIYDDVIVGPGTILHSGVSLRENSQIGANCIIHNNCTIGSDGLGFARTKDKKWLKIPQTGRVVIEDDVEIGANTAIDCASVGESRIKRGTKIDNLVQIGHSCTVGEDSLICAQTGLAGSSIIGDRVILAGQVGIAGHLKVGDDATATAKSGLAHDVDEGSIVSGYPAIDNREWLRSSAAYRRLGTMARTLRRLEKKITELEEKG